MPISIQNQEVLSHQLLVNLLHYDPETGVFTYKHSYSNKYEGDIAGGIKNKEYYVIQINRIKYFAHRLAWFYVYKEWPPDQIDHINRIKNDNRIENLRCVTNSENGKNLPKNRINNTSGYPGITWNRKLLMWRASIYVNGVSIALGCYANKELAILARKAAEIKYGFNTH